MHKTNKVQIQSQCMGLKANEVAEISHYLALTRAWSVIQLADPAYNNLQDHSRPLLQTSQSSLHASQ